ncbi:MAG: response regulator [Rhizorhabdus sp.]
MKQAPTLLVVDDEPLIRASLADALQDAGFNVIESSTGKHAVGMLVAPDIAGIVTDIRLGAGPNGWDVARYARQQHPRIAVVYMTGDSASEWEAEGVPTSVMIQKPFAIARIVTAVSSLLNGSELLPERPAHPGTDFDKLPQSSAHELYASAR